MVLSLHLSSSLSLSLLILSLQRKIEDCSQTDLFQMLRLAIFPACGSVSCVSQIETNETGRREDSW